jgi:tRNA guanosine-2'-O-methyltransferase
MGSKEYTAVSVTAEKWIRSECVPVASLPAWLGTMRERGYAIVGLEQTHNSVPLDSCLFPRKCVLVLGNELRSLSSLSVFSPSVFSRSVFSPSVFSLSRFFLISLSLLRGMPASLVALLDLVVEIPQRGTIRSLNVHVSASIVISRYCAQHASE